MAALVDLPDLPWREWTMRTVFPRDTARMEGRYTESAEFGFPYWRLVEAATPFLTDEQIDAAEVFIDLLDRAGGYFVATDPYRPRPRAYGEHPLSGTRAAGGAFDGSCDLVSIDSPSQLALAQLPAAFDINHGCLVEVRKTALTRTLHRVVEAVLADGSGTVAVRITPQIDAGVFSDSDTVHFERPGTVMMVDDIEAVRKAWSARTLRFSAVEAFPNEP